MPPENTPAFAVVYADKAFGRPVAETLVQSFYLKFGALDPKTIEAQTTLDRLCGVTGQNTSDRTKYAGVTGRSKYIRKRYGIRVYFSIEVRYPI